jgi:hypothetical protein
VRDTVDLRPRTGRGASAWLLMVLEAQLAVGAYGGALMMTLIQPDDFLPPAWLARTPFDPPAWLARTPFDSWVLPGIGLLLANAVLPTVALVVEARGLPWAFLAHAAVGGVLVGWITLQLLVIGYVAPAFQIGYLSLGLVILGLALRGLRGTARSGTA